MKELIKIIPVLLWSLISMNAQALVVGGKCGNQVSWNYNQNTKELILYGQGETWDMGYIGVNQPWNHLLNEVKTLTIQEGITRIGYFCLYDLRYVESITLPTTLKVLEYGSMSSFFNIKRIKIPAGLELWGAGVFANTTSLEEMICLSETPYKVGEYIYFNYDKTTVYVPAGSIEKYKATEDWKNFNIKALDEIMCGDDAYWKYKDSTLTISGEGETWNTYNGAEARPWGIHRESIHKIIVEEGITGLGYYSLAYNYAEEIVLPSSLETITVGSFCNSGQLKEITLPKNLKRVDAGLFFNCWNLVKITIESSTPPEVRHNATIDLIISNNINDQVTLCVPDESVEKYKEADGWELFKNIKGIEEYKIEKEKEEAYLKTKCGDSAFWSLQEDVLRIYGTGKTWDMQDGGYGQPWLDKRGGIRKVIVEEGITHLDFNTLSNLSSMEDVELPKSLERIGSGVFECCFKLTTLTIPENVTMVGEYFIGNSGVKKIYCMPKEPPVCENIFSYGTFFAADPTSIELYVPTESVEKYKTTGEWNEITNIKGIGAEEEQPEEPPVKNKEARLKSININQGTLQPAFTPENKKYVWRVTRKDPYLRIWAEAMHPNTSVSENEYTPTHIGNDTTFIFKTTAEDERYKATYEIKLEIKSDDASLSNLQVVDFNLTEEFQPWKRDYSVYVPSDTRTVKIVAVPKDPKATLNGAEGWKHIAGSKTIFQIDVLAEDRETKETYVLNVIKENKTKLEEIEGLGEEKEVRAFDIVGRFLGRIKRINGNFIIPEGWPNVIIVEDGNKYLRR